jgi:hypothetical protein
MLALRRGTGQQEEIVGANTALADHDLRVQRHQGDSEVAGIGGDAGFAGPEHRVVARRTAERGAAAAGRPLVAVREGGGVAEIGAAGPLHQVAADRRHVAELGGGGLPQRL